MTYLWQSTQWSKFDWHIDTLDVEPHGIGTVADARNLCAIDANDPNAAASACRARVGAAAAITKTILS